MSNAIKDFFAALAGFGKTTTAKVELTEAQKAKQTAFFAAMDKRGYKFAIEERILKNGKIVSYDTDTKTAMMLEGDEFRYLDAGDYDLADGSKLRVEDAIAGMTAAAEEVGTEMAAEEPVGKMGSYTLEDGRTIEIGVAGEPVMIDGVVAAEGEYRTGDGIVIRVAADGTLIEQLSKMTAESLPMATAAFKEVETLKAEIVKLKAIEAAQKAELVKLAEQTTEPRPKQPEAANGKTDIDKFAEIFQKHLNIR